MFHPADSDKNRPVAHELRMSDPKSPVVWQELVGNSPQRCRLYSDNLQTHREFHAPPKSVLLDAQLRRFPIRLVPKSGTANDWPRRLIRHPPHQLLGQPALVSFVRPAQSPAGRYIGVHPSTRLTSHHRHAPSIVLASPSLKLSSHAPFVILTRKSHHG